MAAAGMGSFGNSGLSAATMPFADIASHAIQLAPTLEFEVKTITARVQKLERSRGQISKDLADMLNDVRDLRKKVGGEDDRKQAAGKPEPPAGLEEPPDGAPPGLGRRLNRTKTAPPSAVLARVPEEQPLLAKSKTDKIPPPPGLALQPMSDSLTVQTKEEDGVEIARIEWRIDNVKAKFKDCVGRPLVSPQFEAGGLSELRLMVSPNLGLDTGGLTMREQKSRYEARIAEGPLSGALKFKVVTNNFPDKLDIKFKLFVGEIYQGPIEHDFADHIIHGVDFKNNWLDQMSSGALVVGVEVLTVRGASPSVAAARAAAEGSGASG